MTWKSLPTLDARSIDRLIEQCDIAQEDFENDSVSYSPFAVFRSSCSPVRDFECANLFADFDELSGLDLALNFEASRFFMPEFQSNTSLTILRPITDNRLAPEEADLFHHYVSYVAPMLMPWDDTGNPWISYPAIALHYSSIGRKYLLHALLAHAAVLRANIGVDKENMHAASGKYYILAMKELRKNIEENSVDYVGLLTTMMTFLFIELFRGTSKTWRCHYNAAWKFLQQQRILKMWTSSEDAWYATQSFYLLRIINETSLVDNESSRGCHAVMDSADDIPLTEFSSNPRFGYTMGASNTLMSCISDINRYSQRRWVFGENESIDGILTNILEQLKESKKTAALSGNISIESDGNSNLVSHRTSAKQAHLQAYSAAALIYFYHEFHDLPPKSMAPYVSEVLNAISIYAELAMGNYTLWPVFIAAVEVYEENDKCKVQELLSNACGVGMENRVKVRNLVERIWEIRDVQALETRQDKGMIRVDWRNIMHISDLDVLLV